MYIVLQCCSSKNGCMKVWNELYIYIYRTIFCVWERLLENCNTATKCCRFQISVDSFYSLSFSGEKKSKKVDKKFVNRNWNIVPLHSIDWTRTGLQPTFDIFREWGAVHVVTRKMRKKRPLPPPPFKVTIRMRLSKEKTEGEWNGKWLTFVLWQTYIHQKGTLFVQYRNSSNSCWSMIILERNCPLP